jgi:hypothetical protein
MIRTRRWFVGALGVAAIRGERGYGHLQAPSGNLVDIRPIDGLPIANDSVQTRFGKLARPVTLIVFNFAERLQETYL